MTEYILCICDPKDHNNPVTYKHTLKYYHEIQEKISEYPKNYEFYVTCYEDNKRKKTIWFDQFNKLQEAL